MKHKQRGLTLIEILSVLGVSGILLMTGSMVLDNKTDDITIQGTAQYQAMINNASLKYMQANYQTLINTATATDPVKVTFSQLVSGGYIPANFATTNLNSYSQESCLLVLRPDTNRLRALAVTEGGNNIPTGKLAYVASKIGVNGGYIEPSAPTVAKGAYGGWSESITNYVKQNCSGFATGANHLASLIDLDGNNLLQDYVYRESLPNQSTASRMMAPPVMGFISTEGDSCTQRGAVSRDSTGAILVCNGSPLTWNGFSGGGGSVSEPIYWSNPLPNKAALDAITCNESLGGQYRIVETPTVGSKPVMYACKRGYGSYYWVSQGLNDNGDLTDSYGGGEYITPNRIDYIQMTGDFTEGASCEGGGLFNHAGRNAANGTIFQCRNIIGMADLGLNDDDRWYRPEDMYYRNPVASINHWQFFTIEYDYIGPTLKTSLIDRKIFLYHPNTPPAGNNNYIPLAKGFNLNGTASDIVEIVENSSSTQNVTITATCNTGTIRSGICSGGVADMGTTSGNGWSCTSLNQPGNTIRALAFCGS